MIFIIYVVYIKRLLASGLELKVYSSWVNGLGAKDYDLGYVLEACRIWDPRYSHKEKQPSRGFRVSEVDVNS